jgi:hypothetical protein
MLEATILHKFLPLTYDISGEMLSKKLKSVRDLREQLIQKAKFLILLVFNHGD